MRITRQAIAFNILDNFKEVQGIDPVTKATEILNDNFNKGLIDELETEEAFEQLDNLLEKGVGGHKYYKREGTPGNYKYYYTEAEYRAAKGSGTESTDNKTLSVQEITSKIREFGKSGKMPSDEVLQDLASRSTFKNRPNNLKEAIKTSIEAHQEELEGKGKESSEPKTPQYEIGERVRFFDNGRNKDFKGVIRDYAEKDGKISYTIKIDGRTDVVEGVSQKDVGKIT